MKSKEEWLDIRNESNVQGNKQGWGDRREGTQEEGERKGNKSGHRM